MSHLKAVDNLNSLLRGELAATETYQQALEVVRDDPKELDLRGIQADHREAANELRIYVHHFGGEAVHDSGAWGTFAKVVTGAAKMVGPRTTLHALKEGEEDGLDSYEDALKDPEMPPECRTLITTVLMPRCRTHLRVLDRLMSEAKE